MHTSLKTQFATTQAVLFDMDGTLVDSNDLHAEAWAKTLRRFGYKESAAEVRPFIGKGGDKLLKELVGVDSDSAEGKKISAARTELFAAEYAPRVRALPEARQLLLGLKARGIRYTIATSGLRAELEMVLKAALLDDLFTEVVTADDAERSKPDPDIISAALTKLGVSPDQALLCGDTPYDLEAAAKAGVPAIAFRSGGWADHSLKGALAIISGPAELIQALGLG